MTRILDSGTPVVAASANRRMCGIWVADHIVICSPVGSTTTERGSMNAGISRCWRYSRSITMPSVRAFAMASSTLPPVPASRGVEDSTARTCWCRGRGARGPCRAAASLRSSAAGSSSYSTSTSSAASRASAAVRATTTATISPAKATRSTGHRRVRRRDLVGRDRPGVDARRPELVAEVLAGEHGDHVGRRLGRARCRCSVIFACANGLRTMARCSIPAAVMLSVQRVRPVISRWSSLRRRSRPISSAGGGVLRWRSCRRPLARGAAARRRTARP